MPVSNEYLFASVCVCWGLPSWRKAIFRCTYMESVVWYSVRLSVNSDSVTSSENVLVMCTCEAFWWVSKVSCYFLSWGLISDFVWALISILCPKSRFCSNNLKCILPSFCGVSPHLCGFWTQGPLLSTHCVDFSCVWGVVWVCVVSALLPRLTLCRDLRLRAWGQPAFCIVELNTHTRKMNFMDTLHSGKSDRGSRPKRASISWTGGEILP